MVDTESYDSWLAFLRKIRERGVGGVELVVSDAHGGLVAAAAEVFQGAAWQRCAVHLMRDCMREAGSWQLRRRVGRIVSQVFRGRDAATVTAMYHAACDMLEGCCPRAAAVLDVSVNLFFTSFAKQACRSRKGGFTGCANVFSPIPVTA